MFEEREAKAGHVAMTHPYELLVTVTTDVK